VRTGRRYFSWFVCAWLVCQVSAVVAGPLLLAGEELCTCPTDVAGAACPMHHAHQDAGECVVRNAAPVSTVTLASLIGGIGVIPPVQSTSPAVVPANLIPALPIVVISRSERPESPPPRR
jgi:hypothetical protein